MLVTDGVRTFTLFNYEDNGVQWTKGYHVHYDGKVQLHAQVGFSAGDYIRWVKSLESCMLHVTWKNVEGNVLSKEENEYKENGG